MQFDPTLAAVRFGSGLSPLIGPPADAAAILTDVDASFTYFVPSFDDVVPSQRAFQQANKARNNARGTDQAEAAEQAFRDLRLVANGVFDQSLRSSFARQVGADIGFKARLGTFFADHFTVKSRNGAQRHLVTPFVEAAIALHLNGHLLSTSWSNLPSSRRECFSTKNSVMFLCSQNEPPQGEGSFWEH